MFYMDLFTISFVNARSVHIDAFVLVLLVLRGE